MPAPHLPSWEQYGYHAMSEMERFADVLEKMSAQMDTIERRQQETDLRTKLHGTIFGFLAAAVVEAARAITSIWIGHKP